MRCDGRENAKKLRNSLFRFCSLQKIMNQYFDLKKTCFEKIKKVFITMIMMIKTIMTKITTAILIILATNNNTNINNDNNNSKRTHYYRTSGLHLHFSNKDTH